MLSLLRKALSLENVALSLCLSCMEMHVGMPCSVTASVFMLSAMSLVSVVEIYCTGSTGKAKVLCLFNMNFL